MEEDINMFIGHNKTITISPSYVYIFSKTSSNDLPSNNVPPSIKQFINFLSNIEIHLKPPYYSDKLMIKNNKPLQTLSLWLKTYDYLILSNST